MPTYIKIPELFGGVGGRWLGELVVGDGRLGHWEFLETRSGGFLVEPSNFFFFSMLFIVSGMGTTNLVFVDFMWCDSSRQAMYWHQMSSNLRAKFMPGFELVGTGSLVNAGGPF